MALPENVTVTPMPRLEDEGDRYCHLLDDQNRALCFADVTGRPVHSIHGTGTFTIATTSSGEWRQNICDGCGRPRCPKCAEISDALAYWGAA